MQDSHWLEWLFDNDEKNMTNKKKQIIAAAIELFASQGYAATSTKEIAEKAEVAEGTIFKHFNSKMDLMLFISNSIIEKTDTLFESDLAEVFNQTYDSLDAFIKSLLLNRYNMIISKQALFKILLQEIPFHMEIRSAFIQFISRQIPAFIDCIVAMQNKGLVIDEDPDTIVKLILTTIMGFLLSHYVIVPELFQTQNLDATSLETMAQFITRGLTKS